MPIVVDRGALGYYCLRGANYERTENRFGECKTKSELICLGLVNNMPDPALQATEQQFIKLINTAADRRAVHLRLFSLPKIPRTDWGQAYLERSYRQVSELRNTHLDGLIITGTEPRASDLRDEPFWIGLADILDWAEHNTISSIWSCLAAHAAVLHIDGIGRAALGDKCFGIFEQTKVSEHPILEGIPSRFQLPHSRWNEIREDALTSNGYTILAASPESGVDSFAKQRKSLFIFFQGHPEYEARTLLGEYRRDVGRFLKSEREQYPDMPRGYFDEETRAALCSFQERATSERREDLLALFPTVDATRYLKNTWQLTAERLYGNWLSYITTQKTQRHHHF
jgi:homoserine O-succinyltransferase/O-acetyltransferase